MYGANSMSREYPKTKGQYCQKADIYVFAVYENSLVKLAGVPLAKLEASSTPSTVCKYFTPNAGAVIDLNSQDVVCKLWAGDGYSTKPFNSNIWELKDVKVNKAYCAGTVASRPCTKIML